MNMIFVCPNFKKMNLISLLKLQTDFFQSHIYCLVKHYSSILCRTNKMIQEYRNIVRFMYIFALAHIYKDINYAASSGELTPNKIRHQMVRHSKIFDLHFFNSNSFISDLFHEKIDPERGKFIWIPDIQDSINYIIHLIKKYSDTLQNCFIEDSMGWMIPRLKEQFPLLNLNEIKSPEKIHPENKINKIFLYPQSDTLADSLLHVYSLLPPDKTKIITPKKTGEETEDFLKSRKVAFTRYSYKLLKEEKHDVMVFLNDWTKEVQRITAHCRRNI